MNRYRKCSCRGWSLIHLLAALPLFGTFMIMGSKLFITQVQMITHVGEQTEVHSRMYSAMFYLRQDARSAVKAEVAEDGLQLTLIRPDHSQSVWQVRDGRLVRSAEAQRDTLDFGEHSEIRFASSPGAVLLWTGDLPVSVAMSPAMPSQAVNGAGE